MARVIGRGRSIPRSAVHDTAITPTIGRGRSPPLLAEEYGDGRTSKVSDCRCMSQKQQRKQQGHKQPEITANDSGTSRPAAPSLQNWSKHYKRKDAGCADSHACEALKGLPCASAISPAYPDANAPFTHTHARARARTRTRNARARARARHTNHARKQTNKQANISKQTGGAGLTKHTCC